MSVGFTIFGALAFIGLCIFNYERKHAKEVDPKEPFVHDDYDPKKDPTLKKKKKTKYVTI